jgi:hypothetical protein
MTNPLFDRGYTNIQMHKDSFRAVTQPVSGVWSVRFRMFGSRSTQASFNGAALLDPNFHSHDQSQVLGRPLWRISNVASGTWYTVTVDTTTLSNGVHRLALIVDDEGHSTFPGSLANVQMVWFTVQN